MIIGKVVSIKFYHCSLNHTLFCHRSPCKTSLMGTSCFKRGKENAFLRNCVQIHQISITWWKTRKHTKRKNKLSEVPRLTWTHSTDLNEDGIAAC